MTFLRCSRSTLLPLLMVIALLLLSGYADAAASKKNTKSTKKSSDKKSEPKAAAAKKDWNKMTEEEWNAAEQDALDPEDRCVTRVRNNQTALQYYFTVKQSITPQPCRRSTLCKFVVASTHFEFHTCAIT